MSAPTSTSTSSTSLSTSPESSLGFLRALEQRMVILKQEMDKVAAEYKKEIDHYEQMVSTCRGHSNSKTCAGDEHCRWSGTRCVAGQKLTDEVENTNWDAIIRLKMMQETAAHEAEAPIYHFLRQGNPFANLLDTTVPSIQMNRYASFLRLPEDAEYWKAHDAYDTDEARWE